MSNKKYTAKKTSEGLLLTIEEESEEVPNPCIPQLLSELAIERNAEDIKKVSNLVKFNLVNEITTTRIFVNIDAEDRVYVKRLRSGEDPNKAVPLMGPSLIFELFSILDKSISKEIISYIKSNVSNTIDREKTLSLIKGSVNTLRESAEVSHNLSFDESLNQSEAILFLIAYTTPYLFKSDEEIKMITDPYSLNFVKTEEWMFEPLISKFSDGVLNFKSKTLRRVIRDLNVSQICNARILSEYLPKESLVSMLEDISKENIALKKSGESSHIIDVDGADYSTLENFSPTVRKNLIKDVIRGATHVYDAFDMVKLYTQDFKIYKGIKNVSELHDKAAKLIPDVEEDIILENISKNFENLSSFTIDNCEFNILKKLSDFVITGKDLNICIGSITYFKQSIKGESYCYTVRSSNGELIGALQVSRVEKTHRWKVTQLYGENNKLLENNEALRKGLEDIITKLNSKAPTPIANDCLLV